MSRLAKRISVLIAAALTAIGGYLLLYGYQHDAKMWSEDWVGMTVKVKGHIMESHAEKNRIIILAGSNGLFGLDSERMTELVGRRTLNLSTHAGLPLEYHIWLLSKYGREGDLIVMPLEFEYYFKTSRFDSWGTHNLLVWGDEFIESLPWPKRIEFVFSTEPDRVFIGSFVKLFESRVPPHLKYRGENSDQCIADAKAVWESGEYSPKYQHTALNRYGDMQSNEGQALHENAPYFPAEKVSGLFVKQFRELKRVAKDRGVSLLLTWPVAFRNPSFDLSNPEHARKLKALEADLKSKGIPVVGDLSRLQMEREHMHDTRYHLNVEGRKLYTEKYATLVLDELALENSSIIRP